MIQFNFEDKSFLLPTSWEEVTVEHFVNPLFLSGDPIKLLSAITGISAVSLANTEEDLSDQFAKVTDFLTASPTGWKGGEPAESVELLGKVCPVPKDIEMKKFGQKMLMSQAIRKHAHLYAAIPDAIAIYFGPEVLPADQWTEPEQQEKIKAEVLKMPICDVFPIADFFLQTLSGSLKSGAKS